MSDTQRDIGLAQPAYSGIVDLGAISSLTIMAFWEKMMQIGKFSVKSGYGLYLIHDRARIRGNVYPKLQESGSKICICGSNAENILTVQLRFSNAIMLYMRLRAYEIESTIAKVRKRANRSPTLKIISS